MENLQHFGAFLGSWNCFVWIIISAAVTAAIATVTSIDETPRGWKVGFICSISFMLGALATHIPFF